MSTGLLESSGSESTKSIITGFGGPLTSEMDTSSAASSEEGLKYFYSFCSQFLFFVIDGLLNNTFLK